MSQHSPTNAVRLLPAKRHGLIYAALRRDGAVTTEELSRMLGISEETVRRDLTAMERQGLLRRVHGGATPLTEDERQGVEAPFSDRTVAQANSKRAIAKAAAALVDSGQLIIIDVGTTASMMAAALPSDFTGTVATNSLLVAAEMASRPGVEVLVSGGRLRGGDLALSDQRTADFFADLHADLAFVGSGGLHHTAGLTDFHLDEIAPRKLMIANSARSYVLADSTKFNRITRHRVVPLNRLSGVITDAEPPPAIVEEFLDHDGEVIVASEGFVGTGPVARDEGGRE